MMDREVVARLFLKRTGIKYQNWIQAWVVTNLQKQKGGNTKCHCNKISQFNRGDD